MSIDARIKRYFERFASVARTRIGARSVNTYMERTGAGEFGTLGGNPASGPGTLRIMTGRLSSSIIGNDFRGVREGIFNVDASSNGAEVEIGSQTPYAGVHEGGFSGNVTVPAHTRTITQAFGRQISPRQVNVRSFSRSMDIPARPYLLPAIEQEEEFLTNWLLENFTEIAEELG